MLADGRLLMSFSEFELWTLDGGVETVAWHPEPQATEDGIRFIGAISSGWPRHVVELSDGRLLVADNEGSLWVRDLDDPASRELLVTTDVSDVIELRDGRIAIAGAGVHIYDSVKL